MYESFNATKILDLDNNDDLKTSVSNMTLPKIRNFIVPLSNGYNASVKLILPEEITVHTFASYPLILQM